MGLWDIDWVVGSGLLGFGGVFVCRGNLGEIGSGVALLGTSIFRISCRHIQTGDYIRNIKLFKPKHKAMAKQTNKKLELVELKNPNFPNFKYFLPKENKKLREDLLKQPLFGKSCQKVCTKTITLLPKRTVSARTGHGYHLINVNGYRYLNAYIISDPIRRSTQNGFSMEISFAINDFVYGQGVIGETSHFFNFDTYYNPGEHKHKTIRSQTSDKSSTGGLPWLGGTDLTHIIRIPIMGPYVRASVFNEDDNNSREVEVIGYLTT